MEDRLSWLIFGAGAIGTYIGGSLLMHGQKVAFLERAGVIPTIRENGLRLNLHGQEHRILHPDIFPSLGDAFVHSSYDIAIFALKSYDTQQALESIRPHLDAFPPILCLQNGVENEATIASILDAQKVIAGTVTSSVRRRNAGDIFLERARGIGIAQEHPLSSQIASIFTGARINARLYNSALSMKWSKMMTNLLGNASSAILDMKPSEIFSEPDLFAVEVAQLREAINVCYAQGLNIVNLPGTPVRLLTWIIKNLNPAISRLVLSRIAGKGRGEKMPSFHIDLHSGRVKSEVDYLNGAVVRFGEKLNISTPVNRWLNQTLLSMTQGDIPLDAYAHQPQKYLEHISLIKNLDR